MVTVYVLTNPGRQQPEISWLLKVTWWLMVTIIHVLTGPGRQQSEISWLLMLTLVTCGEQAGRQSQAAIWNPLVTHAVPVDSWWPWWLVVTKTHVLTGPRWQSQAAVWNPLVTHDDPGDSLTLVTHGDHNTCTHQSRLADSHRRQSEIPWWRMKSWSWRSHTSRDRCIPNRRSTWHHGWVTARCWSPSRRNWSDNTRCHHSSLQLR